MGLAKVNKVNFSGSYYSFKFVFMAPHYTKGPSYAYGSQSDREVTTRSSSRNPSLSSKKLSSKFFGVGINVTVIMNQAERPVFLFDQVYGRCPGAASGSNDIFSEHVI